MIDLDLAVLPNQTIAAQIEGDYYELTIKLVGALMCATVVRNSETVVEGHRITPGELLLPYPHMGAGNFLLTTEAGALPDYLEFGQTQYLSWLTADEVAQYVGP